MLTRPSYFVHKALLSMRESLWVSVITTATIAASVLVLGVYTLAIDNLSQLTVEWGRVASVAIYLKDGLSQAQWESLRSLLAERPVVARATLVRPSEALERFRARGPQAAALVEGVNPAVLPASIGLTLQPAFADLAAIGALAHEIEGLPGVAAVDYGLEEFERLTALLRLLRYGGMAGALLVALATAFIVANTVRLSVYARRDEIGILGLVGATAWFIRIPFVIEGALWGAMGGSMAAAVMWLLDRWVAPIVSRAVTDVLGGLEVRLFAPDVALGGIVGGVVLAAVASGIAVRRFLDVELR